MTNPNGATLALTELSLEWEMVLKNPTNLREHWGARAARVKKQRLATGLMLRANGVGWRLKPLELGERLKVKLIRVSPRQLDSHDNLRASFKAVVDEVAAFFHIDDADPRIVFDYAQQKGKPSAVRIEFEIEEATR